MIIGFFDESGHPKIEIRVIGRREDVTITPTIDTGFDGQLCLPVEIAIQLGLELVSRVSVELANGSSQKTLVFSGTIEIGNQEVEAEIILTESDDPLIGTGLLKDMVLNIDFRERKVEILPKSRIEI